MGSSISRYIRDLSDVAGFEVPTAPTHGSCSTFEKSNLTDSQPETPTKSTDNIINWDPRSPTAEIVRTPIEVASKCSLRMPQDSLTFGHLNSQRSYLETDLDTLSTTSATVVDNEDNGYKSSSLPSGLTNAHLLKLRFLGIDPRSPSSDIVRTPIQLEKGSQRVVSPFHLSDTLSVGSVSSHDIFNNSLCSSEFIRDCSDPSAFLSENEDVSDKEDMDINPDKVDQELVERADVNSKDDSDNSVVSDNLVEDDINLHGDGLSKTATKLLVFRERGDENIQTNVATPESTKKLTGHRARTPLTPICNQNRTPNSILRAKQSQTIEKEILTKVKIFATEECVMTPAKTLSVGSGMKENALGRTRKGVVSKSENPAPIMQARTQWDQDNSVII